MTRAKNVTNVKAEAKDSVVKATIKTRIAILRTKAKDEDKDKVSQGL